MLSYKWYMCSCTVTSLNDNVELLNQLKNLLSSIRGYKKIRAMRGFFYIYFLFLILRTVFIYFYILGFWYMRFFVQFRTSSFMYALSVRFGIWYMCFFVQLRTKRRVIYNLQIVLVYVFFAQLRTSQ